jgi:hypothetical protein
MRRFDPILRSAAHVVAAWLLDPLVALSRIKSSFQILDLYRGSLQSSDVCYKSRRFKNTI